MRRGPALLPVLVSAWLALAGLARADVVELADGRLLVGPDVEATEQGLVLHFEHGDVLVRRQMVHARYEPEDPQGAALVEQDRNHRYWRSRNTEKRSDFTFESTLPARVYPEYRDEVERSFRDLTDALGVERSQGSPPKVCVFRTQEDFLQIGGAGYGVEACFRFVKPLELDFYDDVHRRDVCLRGARWTVAGYALRLAFPRLGGNAILSHALADYYAGGAAGTTATGAARYGVVDGAHAERLRRELESGKDVSLDRLREKDTLARRAWGWSLVHLVMQDEALSKRLVAALPAFEGDDEEAHVAQLLEVLGLEDADAREAFLARWRHHVRALVPHGAVELVRAAVDAQGADESRRAETLYRAACAQSSRDTAALRGLAEVLDGMSGRTPDALEAWQAALAKDPFDADARERVGTLLLLTGKEEDGQREKALAAEIRKALEPDD